MEKQRIWVNIFKTEHYGYIVWEVAEVVGNPEAFLDLYKKAPNGEYIYLSVTHFWTWSDLESYLNSTTIDSVILPQEYILIPGSVTPPRCTFYSNGKRCVRNKHHNAPASCEFVKEISTTV